MPRANHFLIAGVASLAVSLVTSSASAEPKASKSAQGSKKVSPKASIHAGKPNKLRTKSGQLDRALSASASVSPARKAWLGRLTSGLSIDTAQLAHATSELSDAETSLAVVYAVMFSSNAGATSASALHIDQAAAAVVSMRTAPLSHDWQGSFSNKLTPGWDASSYASTSRPTRLTGMTLAFRDIVGLGELSDADRRTVLATLVSVLSLDQSVQVSDLVSATQRFTGPELAAMTIKAGLISKRSGASMVTLEHFAIAHTQVQHERMALGGEAATRTPYGWQGSFAGGAKPPWNSSQMAGAPASKK